MADPLNRDQILDELEYLATVEHALVVEQRGLLPPFTLA